MSYVYPKRFKFKGLAELTYRDYRTTTESGRRSSERERTDFIQNYTLGVEGFIFDPRLATYSGSISLRDRDTRESGIASDTRDINYNFFVTFLPYRPVSLSVYASKTDASGEVFTSVPYDVSSRFYGSTLRITHRKLPVIRLAYSHWDYQSGKEAAGTENDRFEVDVRGDLKSIRTRYLLGYSLSSYSNDIRSYTSHHLRGYSDTTIKREHILRTSLQYSDLDLSNYASLTVELEVSPFSRFAHDYRYTYYHTESQGFESGSHRAAGRWVYRLTGNLSARASLGYGLGSGEGHEGDKRGNSYSLGAGANYRKRILGLDVRSHYAFARSRKWETVFGERRDEEFSYHNLGLGVVTRKLRFCSLYADYDFFALDTMSEDSTVHLFRIGVSGRGPRRLYWTAEGSFQRADRSIPAFDDQERDILITDKGDSSSARVEIGYPFAIRGLSASVNGGYTLTKTVSSEKKGTFYEGRLRYSVLRNLLLMARLRESRDEFQELVAERVTRDLALDLYYRIGKTYLSAEFGLQRTEYLRSLSETQRVVLTLRRAL